MNYEIFLLDEVELVRRRTPVLLQVYLTTGLFVIVSWISFIVPPEVVPGEDIVSHVKCGAGEMLQCRNLDSLTKYRVLKAFFWTIMITFCNHLPFPLKQKFKGDFSKSSFIYLTSLAFGSKDQRLINNK